MAKSSSFVNPTTLSLPSPSPAPESPSEAGPSRKRPRSETSSEDRKEARAHRNRIAAQNSRDRRKAQFTLLERKVAELEEENRQLRAGFGLTSVSSTTESQEARSARDRENEELRERIKTLENGWDAVVKALAAQGLPTGLGLPAPKSDSAPAPSSELVSVAPSSTTAATTTTPNGHFAPQSHLLSFPLSPAPSNSSLDFDVNSSSHMFSSSDLEFISSGSTLSLASESDSESTRHLAAGGLELFSLPYSNVDTSPYSISHGDDSAQSYEDVNQSSPIDDATMEDLFREIFVAPSPSIPSTALPLGGDELSLLPEASSSGTEMSSVYDEETSLLLDGIMTRRDEDVGAKMNLNWATKDIQRLLDMLPQVASEDSLCSPVGVWDMATTGSTVVGVF
ncbi:hypothetical protein C8J56DRAFT_927020 [Mycena floridula]|nr:hypothetical protein C8J56DRAFT_927020 [Mycena floridula]